MSLFLNKTPTGDLNLQTCCESWGKMFTWGLNVNEKSLDKLLPKLAIIKTHSKWFSRIPLYNISKYTLKIYYSWLCLCVCFSRILFCCKTNNLTQRTTNFLSLCHFKVTEEQIHFATLMQMLHEQNHVWGFLMKGKKGTWVQ